MIPVFPMPPAFASPGLPHVPHLPFMHGVPVGAVMAFAGPLASSDQSSPPANAFPVEATGWMYCDGRSLLCEQYPELYSVIGNVYTPSDSPNTSSPPADHFNIPDYRGYFLRGVDDGTNHDPDTSQRTPGSGLGSLQESALQTHDHVYISPEQGSVTIGNDAATAVLTSTDQQTVTGPPQKLSSPPKKLNVSDSETRPVNISVYYIIKYRH